MRNRAKPLLYLAALAVATGLILFAIHSYRHRFVRKDSDLLGLLPGGDVTLFFANVAALRSAGMLTLLAGSTPAGDADYKQFVGETHFDYTRDLDAVAGTAKGDQLFLAVRGHFDWNKLQHYATAHGGGCRQGTCYLPASKPGRWVSFLLVQPNVMAVALSPDESAVEQLRPKQAQLSETIPSTQPLWVKLSHSLTRDPLSLPLAVRIFAISLQSADSVIFSLGRAPDNSPAAFYVELDAHCPNAATAESVRNQLDIQTKMLKLELTREKAQPNPADLTGLLTAGSFQVVEKRVLGTWPVRKELLKTLQ